MSDDYGHCVDCGELPASEVGKSLIAQWERLADEEIDEGAALAYRHCAEMLEDAAPDPWLRFDIFTASPSVPATVRITDTRSGCVGVGVDHDQRKARRYAMNELRAKIRRLENQ